MKSSARHASASSEKQRSRNRRETCGGQGVSGIRTNLEVSMSEAATAAPDLLRWLMNRERDLTAVERYARAHDRAPAAEGRWRDLIPLSAPGPGEQYAFE